VNTNNNKKIKISKIKTISANAASTNTAMNPSDSTAKGKAKQTKVTKSTKKATVNNHISKESFILNSNENKLKPDEQLLDQQPQHQQWIFMNGSCVEGQVILNASNLPSSNNNSNSETSSHKNLNANNENENENSMTLDNILNNSQNGGIKRKRKACDCPNCLKYRENSMTPEELGKKRTHKCHKCTKEYNKTSHLRAHLRAHDNYRPYVCDFKTCGKSFTRSDELKRHKRIHNDDRNFPCTICKKKFLRSDHLNKHLLVHSKSASNSSSNQENKQKPVRKKVSTVKKIKTEDSADLNTMASSVSSSSSSIASVVSESPTPPVIN